MTRDVTGRPAQERRLYARYVCDGGTCEMRFEDGMHAYGVEDLSEGGMRIITQDGRAGNRFRQGMEVSVLSAGGSGPMRPLDPLAGTVAWVESDAGLIRVGVTFHTSLDDKVDFMLDLLMDSDVDLREAGACEEEGAAQDGGTGLDA